MEHVGDIDGIAYVNDSKATNGEAAARALACFDGIFWIAGGRAKEDGLAPAMEVLGGVRAAFLIGECQDAFFDELDGRVPAEKCGDLAAAVARATDRARETGDDAVVLLSPAAHRSTSGIISRRAATASGLSSGPCRRGRRHDPFRPDRYIRPRKLVVDSRPLVNGGDHPADRIRVMLTLAASPPVADRLHIDQYHFVRRQLFFLPLAVAIIFTDIAVEPRAMSVVWRSQFSASRSCS